MGFARCISKSVSQISFEVATCATKLVAATFGLFRPTILPPGCCCIELYGVLAGPRRATAKSLFTSLRTNFFTALLVAFFFDCLGCGRGF